MGKLWAVYWRIVKQAMIDGYNRALATVKENEALARRIKEAGGDPKALDDVKTASIVETRPLYQWRKRCGIPEPSEEALPPTRETIEITMPPDQRPSEELTIMSPASVAPETLRFYPNQPITFGENYTPGFIVGPQESSMRYWNVKANDHRQTRHVVHLYDIYDDVTAEVVQQQHRADTMEIESKKKEVVDNSVEGDLLSLETEEECKARIALDEQERLLLEEDEDDDV